MKELIREKIIPVYVEPKDTITLAFNGMKVLSRKIGKRMLLEEAVIFSVERGDFNKARGGIGGAFLESDIDK